jgi:hypothetical protein
VAHDRRKRRRLETQPDASLIDAGDVEQIVDQPGELLGLPPR